MSNTSTTPV